MKKLIALCLSVLMLACLLIGCAEKPATEGSTAAPQTTAAPETTPAPETTTAPETNPADENNAVVDLNGEYSLQDPEGVEYDERVILYAPAAEDEEFGNTPATYNVLYGKDGKGVYMYTVAILESEEAAAAYQEMMESGTVDDNVYVESADASFFAMMEAFIPDLQTYITTLEGAGMTKLD